MNINSRTSKINFIGYKAGSIVSFTGLRAALIKVKSLISGNLKRCGKNLFNASESIEGSMYSVDEHGNITVTASDGRGWTYVEAETPIKKGTYTLSRNTTGSYCDIRFKNENYATGHVMPLNNTSMTFTVTEDTFFKIKVDYNGVSYPIVDKLQLEVGSMASAYEKYHVDNYTIPVGEFTQIEQIIGVNNIFAEDGNVEVYYVTI